jgi:hypothetical protein
MLYRGFSWTENDKVCFGYLEILVSGALSLSVSEKAISRLFLQNDDR